MSVESNIHGLPTEKDENLERGDNDLKPPLHSNQSLLTENGNTEIPAEQVRVQDNRQSIKAEESEKKNRSVLRCLEGDLEVAEPSPSKQQPSASDASTETKSLERINDSESIVKPTTSDASTETKSQERIDDISESIVKPTTSDASTETKSLGRINDISESIVKPTTSDVSIETKSLEREGKISESAVKSTASNEISPSKASSSDKGLEKVTENIQLIYEGLKDMKISSEEIAVSASGKKGRKPPTTPRARSTPVKPLTSPPLTRSRSRDLRKFPSTPSSPKSSVSRKNSESGSDEIRGRQRAKKN